MNTHTDTDTPAHITRRARLVNRLWVVYAAVRRMVEALLTPPFGERPTRAQQDAREEAVHQARTLARITGQRLIRDLARGEQGYTSVRALARGGVRRITTYYVDTEFPVFPVPTDAFWVPITRIDHRYMMTLAPAEPEKTHDIVLADTGIPAWRAQALLEGRTLQP